MSGTTTPDAIYYQTALDPDDPAAASSAQATSVQAAFANRQNYSLVWANLAARPNAATLVDGTEGYQSDIHVAWQVINGFWWPVDGVFTGLSQITTQVPLPVQGMVAMETGTGTAWTYFGVYNSSTNPNGRPTAGWYPLAGSTINAGLNAFYTYSGTLACGASAGVDQPWTTSVVNNLGGALTIPSLPSTVFTCVIPGTYEFMVDNEWAGNSTGTRACYIQHGLAATPTSFAASKLMTSGTPATAGLSAGSWGRFIVVLAAGDTVKVSVIQTTSGSLNVITANLRIQKIA